jgi:pimeloyl-ACP methyl ester carboxylesterase
VDLRGHGESDWAPDGDYSLEAYGADCKALIAQLEEPPVLVGASLGGISAMIAEGTSKQEVSRCLVLVDIAPRTNSAGIERVRAFMRSGVGGFESIEDAAIAIAEYTPQRVRPINPIGMKKVLRERGGRLFWHWDPKFIEIERPQGSLELVMNNISVPVLLVRGELSDVVTEEYANELLFRMPNVAVVVVAGAAHMIAGDRNDGFSNSVVKFLDENILRE